MALPSILPPLLELLEVLRAWLLLEGVANADFYLLCLVIVLMLLLLYQRSAFTRPPPVPSKLLPRRPGLQILFKPDDVSLRSDPSSRHENPPPSNLSTASSTISLSDSQTTSKIPSTVPLSPSKPGYMSSAESIVSPTESSFLRHGSDLLPDSFAPLLSSSNTDVILNQLTPDLVHGLFFKATLNLREGRHTIPLNKNESRPQLTVDAKGKSCIMARASVGSAGFTEEEDFDVMRPTTSRRLTMVKEATLSLDPPLALLNVAPTLIHLPSLFEDNVLPVVRRVHCIRLVLDLLSSLSSFIESFLWLIESKCQVHLSKVTINPTFRGGLSPSNFRLKLSFTGHVLIFNSIPVPFFSVTLPTFIIPAPHAFLTNLLSPQPLASARLKRENLSQERIILAVLDAVESWSAECKAVATPPALSVDVTLPGGMTVAVEALLGRDVNAGNFRMEGEMSFVSESPVHLGDSFEEHSISSYSAADNGSHARIGPRKRKSVSAANQKPFDANTLMPWTVETCVRGTLDSEKISVAVSRASATHYGMGVPRHGDGVTYDRKNSQITLSGNCVVYRADLAAVPLDRYCETNQAAPKRKRNLSNSNMVEMVNGADGLPSVCSTLLFPDFMTSSTKSQRMRQLMQYDYAFDIEDDTHIDAVSVSVGLSHPMLKGSTIVTTVLESIYSRGSLTAREGAILNPFSRARKRNFLRHLPAIDFTVGIENIFIPEQSMSYHDDGQTRCIPKLQGGRMTIRAFGGFVDEETWSECVSNPVTASDPESSQGTEGIKIIADFGLTSLSLENETHVKEFPELDIFDGAKLITLLSGTCSGRILSHLRPHDTQTSPGELHPHPTSTSPNIFNPLEAYKIDFKGSSVSVKIREWTATLGHRRLIIPSETTFFLQVLDSILDMSFEGKTSCECSWDFQGLSPMLQVTSVGHSPANATHEDKDQVPLLIPALRQGRLNFNVSPVGGITITQAVTTRENREGLYDWKFFNALVSPDEESPSRLLQVLHDKQTMRKLLQVVTLVNAELGQILTYILTQVWRAKEIFDQEGITDPGHAIPGHKMARLLSLFLCGNLSRVDDIVPVIRRVTSGDGLDVVKVKELLQQHVRGYDDWAPEIDRAIRWVSVLLGPISTQSPYVESNVFPLCELPDYADRFMGIPSAKALYDSVNHESHLPLDASFSNLVGSIAPYMSFHQVEYILRTRSRPRDWQPDDLRRLRYVYSVKKKVLEISESYGGLSFLPQSFFVSVFLGEATRTSLRARGSRMGSRSRQVISRWTNKITSKAGKASTLSTLRRRRMAADNRHYSHAQTTSGNEEFIVSPAGRVASQLNLQLLEDYETLPVSMKGSYPSQHSRNEADTGSNRTFDNVEPYELGDSLLGPQDVAILLQAGLTSAMKGSTVVQLNQRMLLDLIASQPKSFAVAVLAEIGKPGGDGSARGLASALMALLELDQSSFTEAHRLDIHKLLETWLPGFKIPLREDYLAGGRWARQSYYEAVFLVATNILEYSEPYLALKGHVQRFRHGVESDPLPCSKEFELENKLTEDNRHTPASVIVDDMAASKLLKAIRTAKERISEADEKGNLILQDLLKGKSEAKSCKKCAAAVEKYWQAFDACATVLSMDKLAFHAKWFKSFYRRNYDALMVKSLFDNVKEDVDRVREWLDALRLGSRRLQQKKQHALIVDGIKGKNQKEQNRKTQEFAAESDFTGELASSSFSMKVNKDQTETVEEAMSQDSKADGIRRTDSAGDLFFANFEEHGEQEVVDSIIDCIFYDDVERAKIRRDPLTRLLISNRPGHYNFTIVLAMGVITEGKHGLELAAALERLKQRRGVNSIRSDTATARSFEFNASKIEEAVKSAVRLGKPFGFLGYSQGCANFLTSESMFLSGSPVQQDIVRSPEVGLVCRQLLFSASNGSIHGPAADTKIQRLIIMCEQSFKYQQGYFSRAFISATLEILNGVMDSAAFHKFIGGAQTFLPEGSRAFWREAQHLPHVPTTVLRGVMEEHTTPECLEMISNLLTKQSGSSLHDSQVHVYDAVGHPIYTKNRNGHILKACDMGGAIQRTHHWSPLDKEVEFVRTKRDLDQASFECSKDRHVFPWVDVNARFGFVKHIPEGSNDAQRIGSHICST